MISNYSDEDLINELEDRGYNIAGDPDSPEQSLDDYSTNELIDYLNTEGHEVFPQSINGAVDAIKFALSQQVEITKILDHIDERDIAKYMRDECDYFVIRDSDDISEQLPGHIVISAFDGAGANFYKSECVKLFTDLSEKYGFDFVYALLEPHKVL